MIMHFSTLAQRFYAYQRERFPLIVVTSSLIPAVLSSGAVVSAHPTILAMLGALVTSVAYLLHIRIIDEHRDFDHDTVHHAARPIQVGVISRSELSHIDFFALATIVAIAIASGRTAFMIALIMLAYSYLAGKEFFIGKRRRRYFFTYNSLNLIQMLLMQVFVYTIFSDSFPFTSLVWAHFLFTSIGTLIFELVRKIKRPGDDGTGKDTYTWYLGFNGALVSYVVLLAGNIILFFWIVALLPRGAMSLIYALAFFALMTFLVALFHWKQRSHRSDQLMQLSFVSLYGLFNVAIFFLKLYA